MMNMDEHNEKDELQPVEKQESWVPPELVTHMKSVFNRYWWVIAFVFVTVIVYATMSCSKTNKLLGIKDDHPAEEFCEMVIQDKTGVDVDLSGDSPEEEAKCQE